MTEEASASGKPALLLTAVVYFSQKLWLQDTLGFPVQSIAQNLDWVNAMCYDYYGPWTPDQTRAHAALYDPNSQTSTSYGIQSWLDAGLPAQKLVMGMPLYGHSWKLKTPTQTRIGAPATRLDWVGYDNEESVGTMVQFFKQKGLPGSVVQDSIWALSTKCMWS
eukprot:Gb_06633 [translate_table: standard]